MIQIIRKSKKTNEEVTGVFQSPKYYIKEYLEEQEEKISVKDLLKILELLNDKDLHIDESKAKLLSNIFNTSVELWINLQEEYDKHSKIFIQYNFTSLNEYIKVERTNRYMAANIKRRDTQVAKMIFSNKKYSGALKLKFKWYLKDKRKDLDNVAFATKFILDGMVKAGAITSDGLKHIKELSHSYTIDKDNIGVEITIENINT